LIARWIVSFVRFNDMLVVVREWRKNTVVEY